MMLKWQILIRNWKMKKKKKSWIFTSQFRKKTKILMKWIWMDCKIENLQWWVICKVPRIAYLRLTNLTLEIMKQFYSKMKKLKDYKRLLPKKKLLINKPEKNLLISKKLTSLPKIEWKTLLPKKKSSKKRTENIFTKFKAWTIKTPTKIWN